MTDFRDIIKNVFSVFFIFLVIMTLEYLCHNK